MKPICNRKLVALILISAEILKHRPGSTIYRADTVGIIPTLIHVQCHQTQPHEADSFYAGQLV